MGSVEKLRTLRSTGVVSWCRKPSRRLRKAARAWAALRVRQALTQDGISFVVEPVLDGPMPPRLAAFAWAGLRLVGFLADFTAALVGLVAVHLDRLLQTRKGQRRLRWYEPAKPTARRCVPDGSRHRPAGAAAGARPDPSARPDCPCDGGSGAPFLRDDLGRLGRVQGILASARAAPPTTRPRLIPGRFALQPAQIGQDQYDGFIPCATLEVLAIQADLQQSCFLGLTQGVQHIPHSCRATACCSRAQMKR